MRHKVTTRRGVVGDVSNEAPALGVAVEFAAFKGAKENAGYFAQEVTSHKSGSKKRLGLGLGGSKRHIQWT
jgi:hypothetical protein